MSRILKRPMFKRGGQSNDGIMSNVVDREQYALGSIDEEKLRSDAAAITGVLDRFAPIQKTRLPLGEVGFLLASGADPIDALGAGYSKFVKADDATRAARAKRDQAAVSTALSSQLKKSKDTRTDLEKKLEAAGFPPGSPEYEAAMMTLIFKDVAPKAGFRTLTQEEISKIPGLDKDKAYQVNLDPTSDNYQKIFTIGGASTNINMNLEKFDQQQKGIVQSGAARDKLVKDLSYVKNIKNQADTITQKITEDPSLIGGIGEIRRGANKIGTFLKDLNIDVEIFLPIGIVREFIFDPNIPTIVALENTLAAGYAKVLYPGQKIAVQQIQQAKEIINLTGLTGSEEVINRIKQVSKEMDIFIRSNETMLGVKEDLDNNQKYRVVDGELVPIKE